MIGRLAMVVSLCIACSAVCAQPPTQSAVKLQQVQANDYVKAANQAEKKHDFNTAFGWFEKAAELGDPKAMYDLGWFYFGGYDIPGRHFQDYRKAAFWFQKAVDLNYLPALTQLGVMYDSDGSSGVPRNFTKAAQLFLKAAEAGDAQAMVNLGVMLSQGDGVPRDNNKAEFWWKKAVQEDKNGQAGQAAQSWLQTENGVSFFSR